MIADIVDEVDRILVAGRTAKIRIPEVAILLAVRVTWRSADIVHEVDHILVAGRTAEVRVPEVAVLLAVCVAP